MRGRALIAVAAAITMAAGVGHVPAGAADGMSISRASGPSPFSPDGCGQLDHFFWGAQSGMEADVSLAVNPEDPQHLVAAWVQDESFGIVTATSFDAGATWSRAVVPGMTVCSGGDAARVLHARLAFGPGGNVWVAGETLDGYFPDPRSGVNGVPVASSADGGLTWSTAVRVDDALALNGLNHIVADPSSPGSVVVSWHNPEPVATSYLSRSDDGGATWQRTVLPAYAPDALPFRRLVIGADGSYHDFVVEGTLRNLATDAAVLSVRRSSDRGTTWTEPVTIATGVSWQWPSAVVAPDGTVHVQWLAERGDGTGKLLAARSTDGGATWSAPVVAATNLVGPLPGLAVTPSGVLAAGHVAGAGSTRELRMARSTDGGATWTTTLVDGPYATPSYEGFYNETVAASDGSVAVVYTRTGPDIDGPTDVYVAVSSPEAPST